MRCVESCTYREMPNSMPRLKNHIEHCDKCIPADQITVVWEDGEFVAVREIEEGAAVEIPIVLEAYEEPEIPEPFEPAEPAMVSMEAPKKRKKKREEESDEF